MTFMKKTKAEKINMDETKVVSIERQFSESSKKIFGEAEEEMYLPQCYFEDPLFTTNCGDDQCYLHNDYDYPLGEGLSRHLLENEHTAASPNMDLTTNAAFSPQSSLDKEEDDESLEKPPSSLVGVNSCEKINEINEKKPKEIGIDNSHNDCIISEPKQQHPRISSENSAEFYFFDENNFSVTLQHKLVTLKQEKRLKQTSSIWEHTWHSYCGCCCTCTECADDWEDICCACFSSSCSTVISNNTALSAICHEQAAICHEQTDVFHDHKPIICQEDIGIHQEPIPVVPSKPRKHDSTIEFGRESLSESNKSDQVTEPAATCAHLKCPTVTCLGCDNQLDNNANNKHTAENFSSDDKSTMPEPDGNIIWMRTVEDSEYHQVNVDSKFQKLKDSVIISAKSNTTILCQSHLETDWLNPVSRASTPSSEGWPDPPTHCFDKVNHRDDIDQVNSLNLARFNNVDTDHISGLISHC